MQWKSERQKSRILVGGFIYGVENQHHFWYPVPKSIFSICVLFYHCKCSDPLLIKFEKHVIVEEGYFVTKVNQISEGSRQLQSVVSELEQTLLQQQTALSQYMEEWSTSLVENLPYESSDDDDSDHNKRVSRRQSMVELETRGVIPKGYWTDVTDALQRDLIRSQNVIHDLTSRMRYQKDVISKYLASKLMSTAIDESLK